MTKEIKKIKSIKEAFDKGKAFITFITCGDPDIVTSKEIIKAAIRGGADIVEIGIPFSDPTAEGPVIQEANERALKAGITTDKIFAMVKELREEGVITPLVFMTYANVVYSYGDGREVSGSLAFAPKCKEVGINGVILPDLPFEEKEEFDTVLSNEGIDLISLIAPTSENRIAMIAKEAKGFIYVVSSLGVTGVRSNITTDIGHMVKLVKENTDIPCAVGFGISKANQAKEMAALSDGAIVGSAIMKIVAKEGVNAPKAVEAYVKEMAEAIHE